MTSIDLFLIHGDLPSLLGEHEARWSSYMVEEDRARAEVFRHNGARAQFVIGRELMRDRLVSLGLDWHAVDRSSEKFRHPDVFFNLSHVDGLVALALDSQEIGLDVEFVGRTTNRTQLMPRQYVASEIAWVDDATSDAEHRLRFFTLWTIKEALLKAEACGLRVDTRRIVVDPASNTVDCGGVSSSKPWDFYSTCYGEHPICICTPAGDARKIRVYKGIPDDWTEVLDLDWKIWKNHQNG